MTRTAWSILLLVLLGVFPLVFPLGCARPAAEPVRIGIDSQASDPTGTVVVRTHIDRDKIGVADRLWVRVELEWTPPTTAELVEPDWESSAWTLIEMQRLPAEQTQTGFQAAYAYLLEPFLPGDYETPVFVVEIYPESAGEKYQLESVAMEVNVRSALDAQDAGTLDMRVGFVDPLEMQADSEPRSNLGLWAGIGGVLAMVFVVLWQVTRTDRAEQGNESVYAQLRRVAQAEDSDSLDGYDTLYRAFTRLDPRLQQTSEIKGMIDVCERARFSADEVGVGDPQTMARHTLELLGAGGEA